MTYYTDNMPHTVTYWAPGVSDGQGGITFDLITPVAVPCRWQEDVSVMRDAEGREFTSAAVVYIGQNVELLGWMAEGDHTGTNDPSEVEGAHEVRLIQRTSTLDGSLTLVKVTL